MRPLNERYALSLPESTKYRPFPGRHPLRLFWRCLDQVYVGRPSRTAIQRLRNLAFGRKTLHPYSVVVFDRAGRVIEASQAAIRTSETTRYYFPWSQIDSGFAFLDRFFFKKLGRWHAYSPYPVLKKRRIDEFKAMMAAGGPAFQA